MSDDAIRALRRGDVQGALDLLIHEVAILVHDVAAIEIPEIPEIPEPEAGVSTDVIEGEDLSNLESAEISFLSWAATGDVIQLQATVTVAFTADSTPFSATFTLPEGVPVEANGSTGSAIFHVDAVALSGSITIDGDTMVLTGITIPEGTAVETPVPGHVTAMYVR